MLADLNVPWPANPTPTALASLSKTLLVLADSGYTVVALNHIIHPTKPNSASSNKSSKRPQPSSGTPASSSALDNPIDLALLPIAPPPQLTILTRATIVLNDTPASSTQAQKLTALSLDYDILAVRPTTERSLLLACTSYDAINLISLDVTARLPCFLKHKTIGAAIARGLVFEVCYAGGADPSADQSSNTPKLTTTTSATTPSASSSDTLLFDEAGAAASALYSADTRKHLIAGAAAIIRAIRGKRAIIVSSEAYSPLVVRGPYDVVNLATTWGLDHMRARDAIGKMGLAVIRAAQLRRHSYKQVISLAKKRRPLAAAVPLDNDDAQSDTEESVGNVKRRKFV